METTNILTDEIVTEVADEIVTETGLGTGTKVVLGLLAATGVGVAGYKIYKHFKNKKEDVAVIEAEGEVAENAE